MTDGANDDVSRVADGAVVTGDIETEGNLRVEGTVRGDIDGGGVVTIAEGGEVRGNVSAERLVVAGRVEGELNASGEITVGETADVAGELTAPLTAIEEGATVEADLQVGIEPAPEFFDEEASARASSG